MTATPDRTPEPAPDRGPAAPLVVRDLDWSPTAWLLLLAVCGALFLDGLDTSMMGVALPSIGRALDLDAGTLQWLVTSYVLGFGSFLLLGGRTSDLISRRRVFLVAVVAYGVASVISAGLSDPLAIIALRFVKGVAAGFTVPAGLSILTTTFAEGPARTRALGIYTLGVAGGYSLGLVFGGLLTEIGWRATLLFPGPVALALAALGWKVVPRAEPGTRAGLADFDIGGAVTVTGALLALVYAVVEAPARGWQSASTVVPLVLSSVLMISFVVIELRHPNPLIRLGILRSARVIHANISGFALFGSFAAFQFIATLYVQDVLGYSPLHTAVAFLPIGLIVVLLAPRLGPLIGRIGTAKAILAGLLIAAVGYGLFLRADPSASYVEFLLPTVILFGVGFSLAFASINEQATSGVPDEDQGLASGLVATSLQLGTVVVLAVASAILVGGGDASPGQVPPGQPAAVSMIVGVLAAVSVLTVGLGLVQRLRRRRAETPRLVEEMKS